MRKSLYIRDRVTTYHRTQPCQFFLLEETREPGENLRISTKRCLYALRACKRSLVKNVYSINVTVCFFQKRTDFSIVGRKREFF